MICERQTSVLEGRFDIRTCNNFLSRVAMIYEHLTTFSIGALWYTNIYLPSLYWRYCIRTYNILPIGRYDIRTYIILPIGALRYTDI